MIVFLQISTRTKRDHSLVGVLHVTQVPQHHACTEGQGGGVSQVLASNVRGCSVHCLSQAQTIETNVCGGSQTQATDQTGAQITDDITVQVRHDQDVELGGVTDQLHAGVVDNQLVVLDVGVLGSNLQLSVVEGNTGSNKASCPKRATGYCYPVQVPRNHVRHFNLVCSISQVLVAYNITTGTPVRRTRVPHNMS